MKRKEQKSGWEVGGNEVCQSARGTEDEKKVVEDLSGLKKNKRGASWSGRFFRLENQNCAISGGTQGGENGQNRYSRLVSFAWRKQYIFSRDFEYSYTASDLRRERRQSIVCNHNNDSRSLIPKRLIIPASEATVDY